LQYHSVKARAYRHVKDNKKNKGISFIEISIAAKKSPGNSEEKNLV